MLRAAGVSALCFAGGDALSQFIEGRFERGGWDAARTAKRTAYGALVFAPLSHAW
jgi:hypothetical protein